MEPTAPVGASADALALTARAIAAWLDRHGDLVSGLVALRSLGSEAEEAVAAVLAVRAVHQFQLSFELFELLATSTGGDARALLREAGSVAHVLQLNQALYGGALSPPAP